MKEIKLTPRQVMYRLEKYETIEQKLSDYKEKNKKELNRLRKIEERYKKHLEDHRKFKANEIKNFKNESVLKHHRLLELVNCNSKINPEVAIAYNKENQAIQLLINNLNVDAIFFKLDELTSDDVINEKLIIINDNSNIVTQFVETNIENIVAQIEVLKTPTLHQLDEIRLQIVSEINNLA